MTGPKGSRVPTGSKAVPGWAIALAVLHVALAMAFAWVTPYRTAGWVGDRRLPDIGAPDEDAHVRYVQHLLDGRGVPSLTDLKNLPTYEAHQPPTYYALAATWAAMGQRRDLSERDAGLWLRFLNALIGGAGVLGTAMAGLWGYRDRAAAIGAAAFAALLPMNAALSGAVSNDPILISAGCWTLATCLLAVRTGWSLPLAFAAGALAGLGIACKTSGLSLLAPMVAALILRRPPARVWVASLATALALPTPFWIRNAVLYGDPFLIRTFAALSAQDALDPATFSSLGSVLRWLTVVTQYTVRSFFGLFGYATIELPWPLVVAGVLILGWAVLGFARLRSEGSALEDERCDRVVLLFLLAALVLYVRWNLGHFQPQARYLFPALAAFSLVASRGAGRALGRWGWVPLAGVLLAMDAVALAILPGAFARMLAQP
ncbi:MAG: hypothetical protein WHU10_05480 [Fimbriimonadales bacterium]